MIFLETSLPGAYVIEVEKHEDERGFFARSWCAREFAARGLDHHLVQCNVSFNKRKGTLRGLHYQVPPHAEVKLGIAETVRPQPVRSQPIQIDVGDE